MNITASLVKELRERTGAGMMDCKKALVESGADLEKAVAYLKEKGLNKADKKADKITAEGIITLVKDEEGKKASLIEINTETDFVAKNEKFLDFSKKVSDFVFENEIASIEELMKSKIDGVEFEEFLKNQIATIGENIVVRRIVFKKANADELVEGYVHFNKKVGSIIKAKVDDKTREGVKQLLSQINMHISAMGPKYLSYKDLDDKFIEDELASLKAHIEKDNEERVRLGKKENRVPEFGSKKQLTEEILKAEEEKLKQDLKESGKPEKIWDRILPGQIARFIEDNTQIDQKYALFSQKFVLDDSKSVEEVVEEKAKELGGLFEIEEYERFEVGEGLEKKEEDFAAEVAKQMR